MQAITKLHSENGGLVCVFGMSPRSAIEQPRYINYSQPDSFAPHASFPGRLCLESRVPRATADALSNSGTRSSGGRSAFGAPVASAWSAIIATTESKIAPPTREGRPHSRSAGSAARTSLIGAEIESQLGYDRMPALLKQMIVPGEWKFDLIGGGSLHLVERWLRYQPLGGPSIPLGSA